MRDRISIDPPIHSGKPCVTGTGIPVQSVLERVREGIGFEQITLNYYSDLKVEDIRACIQYAIEVLAAEDIHITTVA